MMSDAVVTHRWNLWCSRLPVRSQAPFLECRRRRLHVKSVECQYKSLANVLPILERCQNLAPCNHPTRKNSFEFHTEKPGTKFDMISKPSVATPPFLLNNTCSDSCKAKASNPAGTTHFLALNLLINARRCKKCVQLNRPFKACIHVSDFNSPDASILAQVPDF